MTAIDKQNAQNAFVPVLTDEWLSNADRPLVGYPAPTLPGAIGTADHEGAPEAMPGGQRGGPPAGGYQEGQFQGPVVPGEPEDPGYMFDTGYLEGHEVPWPVAGPQDEWFAPPGAIGNELHSIDTGAVGQREWNPMGEPGSPGWGAARVPGQSYDRTVTYDSNGMVISQPAPMVSSWNRMGQWGYNGYDPYWIPSVELPQYVKVAQMPVPAVPGTPLGPDASTPDMAQMYDGTTIAYEPPPAPSVTTVAPQSVQADIGAEWA